MSRLADLVDLIQTTNEVYFITAPGRVKTAFLLVDDIVELALKSHLQAQTFKLRDACLVTLEAKGWIKKDAHRAAVHNYFRAENELSDVAKALGLNGTNSVVDLTTAMQPFIELRPGMSDNALQHWSANTPDNQKNFNHVIQAVKDFQVTSGLDPSIYSLLGELLERHKTRNKFYHNPELSDLNISDAKCLRALCDLFLLMEKLFPEFWLVVQENKTVRCQIGVLRLKLAAIGSHELTRPYTESLEQLEKNHEFTSDRRSVEHTILHTVSERFFVALRERFQNEIARLQARIDKINSMTRPRAEHKAERADQERIINILNQQLEDIKLLLGTV